MKGLAEELKKIDMDSNSNGMLRMFSTTGYNMYAGTVPYETKQKRRIKNKAARKSRRINRGGK